MAVHGLQWVEDVCYTDPQDKAKPVLLCPFVAFAPAPSMASFHAGTSATE